MSEDPATKSVEEIFKVLIATSGIMLALLWGLTQRTVPPLVVTIIRIASIVLVISIVGSLLGLQFIVTELEKNTAKISKVGAVAVSFVTAWISFLAGCVALIVAISCIR